jgi:hypothetical protein
VVLPQGQFATFLKSAPGHRRSILRELLRLQVYESKSGRLRRHGPALGVVVDFGLETFFTTIDQTAKFMNKASAMRIATWTADPQRHYASVQHFVQQHHAYGGCFIQKSVVQNDGFRRPDGQSPNTVVEGVDIYFTFTNRNRALPAVQTTGSDMPSVAAEQTVEVKVVENFENGGQLSRVHWLNLF